MDFEQLSTAELEEQVARYEQKLRNQMSILQEETNWCDKLQKQRNDKLILKEELLRQKKDALQQFRPIKREYVDDYRNTCINLTNHNSKLNAVIDFVTKMLWKFELQTVKKHITKSELNDLEEEKHCEFRRSHHRSQSMDVDQLKINMSIPEIGEQPDLQASGSLQRRDTSPILKFTKRYEEAKDSQIQEPASNKYAFKYKSTTHEAKLSIQQIDDDEDGRPPRFKLDFSAKPRRTNKSKSVQIDLFIPTLIEKTCEEKKVERLNVSENLEAKDLPGKIRELLSMISNQDN